MAAKIVIGAQWGDEGKGKIIDIMSEKSDVTVRTQGGNNAGHTVKIGEERYALNLVPSGIFYSNNICIIGVGVVVDPLALISEITKLQSRGIDCKNLRIDARAHLIMPYHIELDTLLENVLSVNNQDIGTTGRGIGPTYMDKIARVGIRMCDLLKSDIFTQKVKKNVRMKNKIIQQIYGGKPLDSDRIITEYLECANTLREYVTNTATIIYESIKKGKTVLFEGAQGALLDVDVGTYPYVTSSHPVAGGACVGSGVGPAIIDECIGVMKAYTTRVGHGPFPTELHEHPVDIIRKKGLEFGTVTGRARRCGWFDGVIAKHSVMTSGLTSVVINKIDTLSGLGTLKICIGYNLDGKVIKTLPPSVDDLVKCEPIYEELEGWTEDLSEIRDFDELPLRAQNYIKRIEQLCEVSVCMVGVGPGRDQNIFIN